MSKNQKARYWVGVLYLENMRKNWEDDIGDILQLPYAYCIHNQDVDESGDVRKHHVHIIVVFANTTTYNHALSVFNKLSADGERAINTCESIIGIRSMYEYLIHNTDTCKKKGKKLYSKDLRIHGNNFDIGSYEQLSVSEKNDMCKELCDKIKAEHITNFIDLYECVVNDYEPAYFEVLKSNSGFLERLTKGNYQKYIYLSERRSREEFE